MKALDKIIEVYWNMVKEKKEGAGDGNHELDVRQIDVSEILESDLIHYIRWSDSEGNTYRMKVEDVDKLGYAVGLVGKTEEV